MAIQKVAAMAAISRFFNNFRKNKLSGLWMLVQMGGLDHLCAPGALGKQPRAYPPPPSATRMPTSAKINMWWAGKDVDFVHYLSTICPLFIPKIVLCPLFVYYLLLILGLQA